jgi:hypothetical protein
MLGESVRERVTDFISTLVEALAALVSGVGLVWGAGCRFAG